MRRKDRKLAEEETMSILNTAEYGVLSTVSADGQPYGVPLNYCVQDGAIYFHCAAEGHKIANMLENAKVSFCAVGDVQILPAEFATNYESCIVQGMASEVFDAEKQSALEGLLHKYSEDFFADGLKYIDKLTKVTRVFKITMEQVSGKARRG